ncbi:MAG: CoA pyrophosphatase [Pseudomonadota bacterium]
MEPAVLNPARLERALASGLERSSDYDLNPEAKPRRSNRLRPASVLVPLVERSAGLNVILTRRAARLKHHPGQIAFPGGKQDGDDADALAAALREAREEIGLFPSNVEILGQFGAHETVTNFLVTPFVGVLEPDFVPKIDRTEVDEIFEVPLQFLLDPGNLQTHRFRRLGQWRSYFVIPYGPHYIWGATARMLKALGDRIRSV